MDMASEASYKEFKCYILYKATADMVDESIINLIKGNELPALPIGNMKLGELVSAIGNECPFHFMKEDVERGYKELKELGYVG